MKKIILMVMVLGLMTAPVFAGLVSDPGFENGLTDIHDIGDGDTYYEYAEYTTEMWIVISTGTFYTVTGGNPGQCVRIQTAAMRAVGTVIDDNVTSTGNIWNYTVDLQNFNNAITAESIINLVVQGLPDPWSSTGWKNRINTSAWTFDDGVGTELVSVDIDPTALDSSWKTFSGTLDLGDGYEYIALILRTDDVGTFNSSLRIDNLDIRLIPEPALLGLLGLGILGFIRRK